MQKVHILAKIKCQPVSSTFPTPRPHAGLRPRVFNLAPINVPIELIFSYTDRNVVPVIHRGIKYNNNKVFLFVLKCSHLWCRSRRFDSIQLVIIRQWWWGRLVTRHLLNRMLRDWCVSILCFSVNCYRSGPLSYGSPAFVFLNCGHPRFRISTPLSLLMLLGWCLIWITSLTLPEF